MLHIYAKWQDMEVWEKLGQLLGKIFSTGNRKQSIWQKVKDSRKTK